MCDFVLVWWVSFGSSLLLSPAAVTPADSEDGSELARNAVHCSVLCDRTGHWYLGVQEGKTRREEVYREPQ
ncbi:Hypothetical predicted protein [Scomber scombrus]|uniref:Secreted protein n=1 Tax=Scomber scombrus TaxID=13677 RepID=A0AAV1PGG6_SCOSC